MSREAVHWRYVAEDAGGAVVTGTLTASDQKSAARDLKAKRLQPLQINPAGAVAVSFGRERTNLSVTFTARICRRLADLLNAGLPLAVALKHAGRNARGVQERLYFERLESSVRAGESLATGIAAAGAAPRMYGALVAAGESLGDLGGQFERLAAHFESGVKLRQEIIAQLIYPLALLALIVATFFFLSFFVLPQFEQVFASAGARPPRETRFVLAGGRFIRGYWQALLFGTPIIAWALIKGLQRHAGAILTAIFDAPLIGPLLATSDTAIFLRSLSTLLNGGMTLSRAFPIAIDAVSNPKMRAELVDAETKVRGGARLGLALSQIRRVPKDLLTFVDLGEETGALAAMTGQAATIAETRVRSWIKTAMALLAPGLTAVMGLVTAGVIAAVMSGVLSLNDAVGR